MIGGLLLERHQRTHPPEVVASELVLLVEDLGRGWDHQTCHQGSLAQILQSLMMMVLVLESFVVVVVGIAAETVAAGKTVAVVAVASLVVVVVFAELSGHFLG